MNLAVPSVYTCVSFANLPNKSNPLIIIQASEKKKGDDSDRRALRLPDGLAEEGSRCEGLAVEVSVLALDPLPAPRVKRLGVQRQWRIRRL